MFKQNTGKDRADQLRQEMKKTQHKQNITTKLNYFLVSQDERITKSQQKIGSHLQMKTFGLLEHSTD